jgi:hypothetical protein
VTALRSQNFSESCWRIGKSVRRNDLCLSQLDDKFPINKAWSDLQKSSKALYIHPLEYGLSC